MRRTSLLAVGLLLLGFVGPSRAQTPPSQGGEKKTNITTPKEHLGFNLGDDYCLANYQQLMSYWAKLGEESDRLKVVNIGTTEEGRPQLMGIVTSPANHKKLDHYKSIARKLALAEGVSEAEARKLAAEGKVVVWIDAGLHASEVLCAQAMMETLYQFLAANDKETLRILDDVIILFVHANPDGMDLVADHYMKNKEPAKRSSFGLPRLYQKYIGHDNNRDSYGHTQAETKNMNRVMYREWFPQIAYDHHQTGPAGTVVFIPPCRDPSNYNIDPMVLNGIDALSNAMIQRLLAEGKPGATVRSGARFSTWWNGGIVTTCQFHNMIGIFTETWGTPAPTTIPYLAKKLLPNGDYLAPIHPQKWHFRQSMDYSVSGNKAVADYAARNREHVLFNIWRMGMNSIERGSRDNWTVTPKMVEPAAKATTPLQQAKAKFGGKGGFGGGNLKDYEKYFRDPAKRDARAYILPANQPDFLTATKFINTLIGTGVTVQRATADFTVVGRNYPKGSYVVACAQAFRPHIIDMFEPQDHPNDFAYPGATPTPPYDSAGYTPAFQMGIEFDRILEGFRGPFETLADEVQPPPAAVTGPANAVGYFLDTRMNDSFRAVNQLLKAGEEVRRLQQPFVDNGWLYPAGTFFIARKQSTQPLLERIARELGTPFMGSTLAPSTIAADLKPARVALWDRKGGSMTSGWTRWLLERFEFPFKVVMAEDLKNLRKDFDVLLLIEEAFTGGGKGKADGGKSDLVSELKKFVEEGGTIVATGSSTSLGKQLGLPLSSHLTRKNEKGEIEPLDRDKYYVPSSVLRVRVNNAHPLTWGMSEYADVMFSNAPTYQFPSRTEAKEKNMTRLAWFDTKSPLRSGWAWGQHYLEGGTAMIDAKIGQGRLALFGPHVLYRGQSHGTFKLVFNAIVQASVKTAAVTAE